MESQVLGIPWHNRAMLPGNASCGDELALIGRVFCSILPLAAWVGRLWQVRTLLLLHEHMLQATVLFECPGSLWSPAGTQDNHTALVYWLSLGL